MTGPADGDLAPGGAAEASGPELKTRLETLQRTSFLFSLADSDLRLLARRCGTASVTAGSVIVRQGSRSDSVYIIRSGRAEVVVENARGNSVVLAYRGPGETFGEVSLFDGEPLPATFRALEDTQLLVIDRRTLVQTVPEESDALLDLADLVTQRKEALKRLLAHSAMSAPDDSGDVICFYSPKGGAGCTTLAVNVATHLARRNPGAVALLDLSLPFNHAALMARLVPTSSLANAAADDRTFEETVLSALLHHAGGILVLPAVLRPEEAELITPDVVNRAISVLRGAFKFVLVDLGVMLTDSTVAVLEQANRIVLVATPELSTVKDIGDVRRILEEVLHIPPARLLMVMNNRTVRPVVARSDLERALRQPVHVEIPYDGSKPDEAAVRGEILVQSDPRSAITRAASTISGYLTGAAQPGNDRRDRKTAFFKVG